MTYPGERAADFATLYFELVDTKGHKYGTTSDSLKAAIKKADQLIGYLKDEMQQRGLWDETNIIIVSDHGMMDLSADKTIMLPNIISMENVERVIWGPLTMIQPKEGKGDEVFQALKSEENNYRVYRKKNLPERYHLKNHRRVTDILMIADLGYTILSKDYKEQFLNSLPGATHGYDNNQKAMRPIFIARGPAFKSGAKVDAFQNIHIYELMNYLMGTEPAPNDGTLDSVKVLLKKHAKF
jgi:predicted AlkP superfamily pyrophosphatase or phosphodiesterase